MSTGHYSMIFAFSPDLTDLLLLRKPDDSTEKPTEAKS